MSTVTPTIVEPPHAPRAGADLRAARERLGWSLDDVAHGLRIRFVYLEALEDGRLSLLPGPAYAFAFVRTYARALGLDPEEMTRRFKAEAGEAANRTELTFPVPMPERGLPTGAIMLLGLVMVIGAYATWYRLSGEGRLPAEAVTSIPERLAPLAEQALPSPAVSAVMSPTAGDHGGEAVQPPQAAAAVDPAPAMIATSSISASAAPLPVSAVIPPATTVVPAEPVPVAVPGAMHGAMPAEPEARIVVRATADAWLLVKDHSGAILLNRVLKAGETWPVPARSGLALTTGNAGGTELLVDGASAGALGTPGAVRRDLSLDPDAIKDGKIATVSTASSPTQRLRQ